MENQLGASTELCRIASGAPPEHDIDVRLASECVYGLVVNGEKLATVASLSSRLSGVDAGPENYLTTAAYCRTEPMKVLLMIFHPVPSSIR